MQILQRRTVCCNSIRRLSFCLSSSLPFFTYSLKLLVNRFCILHSVLWFCHFSSPFLFLYLLFLYYFLWFLFLVLSFTLIPPPPRLWELFNLHEKMPQGGWVACSVGLKGWQLEEVALKASSYLLLSYSRRSIFPLLWWKKQPYICHLLRSWDCSCLFKYLWCF